MLVLKRHRDEVIKIGPDVSVVVLRIDSGGGVVIGITAPPELRISRVSRTTAPEADQPASLNQ